MVGRELVCSCPSLSREWRGRSAGGQDQTKASTLLSVQFSPARDASRTQKGVRLPCQVPGQTLAQLVFVAADQRNFPCGPSCWALAPELGWRCQMGPAGTWLPEVLGA